MIFAAKIQIEIKIHITLLLCSLSSKSLNKLRNIFGAKIQIVNYP